jgi:hypothetical protein
MIRERLRPLTVGVSVLAVGVGVLATAGIALAGGGPKPPWESSISPPPNGFITFYNAKGQVVTGGSITANGLGAYAVASSADKRQGDTKATVFVFTPKHGELPLLWSGEQISLSSNYPNPKAPAPIATTKNPVETNLGTDTTMQGYIAALPNTQTTAGYVGLYDVRMGVSGPGLPLDKRTYWDTVISVNTQKKTWSVDWPDFTQKTKTTLTAAPPSPQAPPAKPVTLTATVSPGMAGTVTFWRGTHKVGKTQKVTTTSGVAHVTTTPATGTTKYQAIFTPTIGSHDIGSASSTLSYVVAAPSGPPAWLPVLFGPGRVGSVENCLAAFQGASTVTYAWQSNGAAISGATSTTLTVPASLLGEALTCSVKATNSIGSVSGTSTGVTIALGAPLVPTTKPVISGPHLPGKAEKITAGTWKPAAAKVTYQWFLGTKKVKGATKPSFTVPSGSKGKTVHCVVTASATGYASGTYTTPSVKIT